MSADWLLEELGTIVTGKTPPQALEKAYSVLGTPFLTPKDMDGRKWIASTERYLSEAGVSSVKNSLIPAGSISVSCIGSDMGKAVMVPVDTVTNQQINSIIPDKTKCHPEYLYYLLSTKQQELKDIAGGSATPILNKGHFGKVQVCLPDIGYQAAAAKILSGFDDKIQLNNQINQTLEQMAQAIFKSWFVDFEPVKAKMAALEAGGNEDDALLAAMQAIAGSALFAIDAADADAQTQLVRLQTEHPEQYATLRATAELFPSAMQESELGEIPEGWSVGSVSDLFELHRGFDLPKNSREEGPFEVYAAGGLHGTHSEFKMEPPGIITGRSGVIGNVYLSLKKYWPLNTTLYVREFRACGPHYAYHLLGSLDLKALNSGSAVPSLNRNFVHSMSTLNPKSELLAKFESIAGSLFKKTVGNIDQNVSLENLRDTLLPKLLSGELSVNQDTD